MKPFRSLVCVLAVAVLAGLPVFAQDTPATTSNASGFIGDTLIPRIGGGSFESESSHSLSLFPYDFGPVLDLAVDRANRRLYVLSATTLTAYAINQAGAAPTLAAIPKDPARPEEKTEIAVSGTKLALSLDGRTAYVGSTGKITEISLYPESVYSSVEVNEKIVGSSHYVPAFTKIRELPFAVAPDKKDDPKGEAAAAVAKYNTRAVAAMGVHPAGDRLFVVIDMDPAKKKLAIKNDLLRSDLSYGTRADQLAESALPDDFGYLAQLDISAAVQSAGPERRRPSFAAIQSIKDLIYPKAKAVAIGIKGLAFSPDGNGLFLTAVGAQTVRATAFGVVPTTDEGTGGIVVLDVRPRPDAKLEASYLGFIPTTAKGENTADLRLQILLNGWRTVHPQVQFARDMLDVAKVGLGLSLVTANRFTTGPSFVAFLTYTQVVAELEDSFQDYGNVQAYSTLYPRDMVGASSITINHTGDFGVVTMQDTNNLGLLTVTPSTTLTGHDTPQEKDKPFFSFLATGTGRTINAFNPSALYSFNWAYPQEVVFSSDDSHLYIAMAGGTPKADNTNRFGWADSQVLRRERDNPGSVLGKFNPIPGYFLRVEGGFRSPRVATAMNAFDTDGDLFSDQLEAFNRWNSLRTIPGDPDAKTRRALVSTSIEQLTDPGVPLPASKFKTDALDQSLLLPSSGLGYRMDTQGLPLISMAAGSRSAIAAIEKLGRLWHEAYLAGTVTRPYFVVGAIAMPGGGELKNAQGESLQYGSRNGFQVNFPNMGQRLDEKENTTFTDEPHDFVLTNGPSSPRDNRGETLRGFDKANMAQFLQLLLAEPTVSKIELDPAVRDELPTAGINFADQRFTYHGTRERYVPAATPGVKKPARPENHSRRDLDSQLSVSFSPLALKVEVIPPPAPGPKTPAPAPGRNCYYVELPPKNMGLDRATLKVVLPLPLSGAKDAYIVRAFDGTVLKLGEKYTVDQIFGDRESAYLWVDMLESGDQSFGVELYPPELDTVYSLLDPFEYIQWTEDRIPRHLANCDATQSQPTNLNRTYLRAETVGFDRPITYEVVRWEPAPTETPTEGPSEPHLDPQTGELVSGKDSGTLYVKASTIAPNTRELHTRTIAIDIGGCGGCVTCKTRGKIEYATEGVDITVADGDEGRLRFRSATAGPELLDPTKLEYPFHDKDTRVLFDAKGAIRQVRTKWVLMDILPRVGGGYTVATYPRPHASAFDPEQALYTVPGTGRLSLLTVAPHPDAGDAGVLLTRLEGKHKAEAFAYIYSSADNSWTLEEHLQPKRDPAQTKTLLARAAGTAAPVRAGAGTSSASFTALRRQSVGKTPGTRNGQPVTLTTRTMSGPDGELVSKDVEVFAQFPFGRRIVARISDPDGANRTTEYAYNAQGLVESVLSPGGGWARYEYDSQNRVTKQVQPWLNAAPGAPESECQVTTFDYTPLSAADTGLVPDAPRTTVTRIKGVEVSRSYALHETNLQKSITALKPGAAWDDPGNLVSTTRLVPSGYYTGRTASTLAPDGTMAFYEYRQENGGEVSIVKSGVPNAARTTIVDGTISTTTTNAKDQTISSETRDIATGTLLSVQMALEIDDDGRPTRWSYLDGTESSTVYGCCGVESETDRNGLVTTYEYDDFKRVVATHQLGITSRSEFDTRGRTVKTTQVGTDGSTIVSSRTEYLDRVGDAVDSFDPLGRKTSSRVTYNADGTTTRTTTLTGGYTQWQQSARDGHPLEIGGTAATPSRYEYRTELLGEIPCSVTRSIARVWDSDTAAFRDTQWTESWTDMAGRTLRVVMADGAKAENFYNAKGQLVRSVDPDGVTTLYAYNSRGERNVTAVDLNRNGEFDYAGADRISRTTSGFASKVWEGQTIPVVRSTSEVWSEADKDTPLQVSTQEQSVDGRHAWTTSFGVTAHQETIYPQTRDGSWTVKSTAPDGTSSVTEYAAGRLSTTTSFDRNGAQLTQIAYAYDSHGRPNSVTQPTPYSELLATRYSLLATTSTTYFDDGQVDTVKSTHPEIAGQFLTTKSFYNERGLLEKRQLPDGSEVSYTYTAQGQLDQVHGSQTYPLDYDYDSQGRMVAMTTWQNYAGDSGKATTTWQFDPQRGHLTSKTYSPSSTSTSNLNPPVSYRYTPAGRLETRTWSRGLSTSYAYRSDGALASVDYSDATPDIAYSYHRLGQVAEVRDGVLANGAIADADLRYRHAYAFDPATLRPDTETIATFGQYQLQRHYESTAPTEVPGRYKGYTLSSASAEGSSEGRMSSVAYSYDSTGRLEKVTSGASTFTYAYLPNAALIESVTGPVHTVRNTYQPFGYGVLNKTNKVGDTVVSSFGYKLNDLGQRTAMINTGTAFAQPSHYQYRYNEKGEVIAGNRFEGADPNNPGAPIPTDTFAYQFDDIGNRLTATRALDPETQNPKLETYSANLLNQYTQIDTSLASSASVSQSVAPEHDADGNLVSDSRWRYTWNAENRLVEMESVVGQGGDLAPRQKLLFAYDYQGRRVSKNVYSWNLALGTWNLERATRFLYDGWNLVAEFSLQDSALQLSRSFVWGIDLSGTLQGAGGVGGLLSVSTFAPSDLPTFPPASSAFFPTFDSNGNISEYLDSTGIPAAHFEYSPFGQTLRSRISDSEISDIPFRFSTKYTDTETGLLYYGFRYYDSVTGRWLSRDPIEETSGANIYGFVNNKPIGQIDMLGLMSPITIDAAQDVLQSVEFQLPFASGIRINPNVAAQRKVTFHQPNSRFVSIMPEQFGGQRCLCILREIWWIEDTMPEVNRIYQDAEKRFLEVGGAPAGVDISGVGTASFWGDVNTLDESSRMRFSKSYTVRTSRGVLLESPGLVRAERFTPRYAKVFRFAGDAATAIEVTQASITLADPSTSRGGQVKAVADIGVGGASLFFPNPYTATAAVSYTAGKTLGEWIDTKVGFPPGYFERSQHYFSARKLYLDANRQLEELRAEYDENCRTFIP